MKMAEGRNIDESFLSEEARILAEGLASDNQFVEDISKRRSREAKTLYVLSEVERRGYKGEVGETLTAYTIVHLNEMFKIDMNLNSRKNSETLKS